MFIILLCLAIALITFLFITNKKYDYWKNKKIPHIKPLAPFGNFQNLLLFKSNIGSVEQKICQKFKDSPLIGAYFGTEPVLIVQDPEVIKLVTTKDFYYFSNREVSEHVHKESLTKNLFASYGDEWKILRQNLTPLFSSAKMKNMFYLIDTCAKTFEKLLDYTVEECPNQEVRSVVGRFTMDCIGSCAFGLDTKAMDVDSKTNPFRNIGDKIFESTPTRSFRIHARSIWPGIFYALGLTMFPKEIDTFFSRLMINVFEDRKNNEKAKIRNDFVDLVLNFNKTKYITGDSMKNLKNGGKEKKQLDVNDELLVAQCFVFFAAGYETSATTTSFTLYELAKSPDAQQRARDEVDKYLQKHNGILGYECVNELPYLDQCIDETLRLYPVLGVITREVVEPYTFQDHKLTLEKGMRIHLPVYHMQRNPKYFPEPDQFKPERFSAEGKKNITPYTYFPFGEGPRICIGKFKLEINFNNIQVDQPFITFNI